MIKRIGRKGESSMLGMIGAIILIAVVVGIGLWWFLGSSTTGQQGFANLQPSQRQTAIDACKLVAGTSSSATCVDFKKLSGTGNDYFTCDNKEIRAEVGNLASCTLADFKAALAIECKDKVKKFPAKIYASDKVFEVKAAADCDSVFAAA